jgi:iron-sulfur cluster repair protein YtfE (RIC family)
LQLAVLMKATELLKSQHDEAKSLFAQIEASDDTDEKDALFEELADSLAAHTTIEEKVFYPAAYEQGSEELLREAVEEHLSLKRLISDLLDLDADDDGFDASLKVLKEQFEHHVNEEESQLFPKVEKALGASQLAKLGVTLEDLFDQEMLGEPREEVRGQLDQPAPLP